MHSTGRISRCGCMVQGGPNEVVRLIYNPKAISMKQLMASRNSGTTKFFDGRRRRRTSNVRLPLELGSDRRETSATRVSDDLQLSIFRRRKKKISKIFGSKNQIFVSLVRFWRTYGRTDVKISFLVKFCSRKIHSEVRTTKNRQIRKFFVRR